MSIYLAFISFKYIQGHENIKYLSYKETDILSSLNSECKIFKDSAKAYLKIGRFNKVKV